MRVSPEGAHRRCSDRSGYANARRTPGACVWIETEAALTSGNPTGTAHQRRIDSLFPLLCAILGSQPGGNLSCLVLSGIIRERRNNLMTITTDCISCQIWLVRSISLAITPNPSLLARSQAWPIYYAKVCTNMTRRESIDEFL